MILQSTALCFSTTQCTTVQNKCAIAQIVQIRAKQIHNTILIASTTIKLWMTDTVVYNAFAPLLYSLQYRVFLEPINCWSLQISVQYQYLYHLSLLHENRASSQIHDTCMICLHHDFSYCSIYCTGVFVVLTDVALFGIILQYVMPLWLCVQHWLADQTLVWWMQRERHTVCNVKHWSYVRLIQEAFWLK